MADKKKAAAEEKTAEEKTYENDPMECGHENMTPLSDWSPAEAEGMKQEFQYRSVRCEGCGIEVTEGRPTEEDE